MSRRRDDKLVMGKRRIMRVVCNAGDVESEFSPALKGFPTQIAVTCLYLMTNRVVYSDLGNPGCPVTKLGGWNKLNSDRSGTCHQFV